MTSLTEYHQQELQKIQAEREALIKKFEEKKTSRCQSEYSLWLNISLLFRFEHGFAGEGARVISSGGRARETSAFQGKYTSMHRPLLATTPLYSLVTLCGVCLSNAGATGSPGAGDKFPGERAGGGEVLPRELREAAQDSVPAGEESLRCSDGHPGQSHDPESQPGLIHPTLCTTSCDGTSFLQEDLCSGIIAI